MTKTLATITYKGIYRIIHDSTKESKQYGLYYEYYDNGKHRNLVKRYNDIQSCLACVMDIMNNDKITQMRIAQYK